jgi:hypothetical protein
MNERMWKEEYAWQSGGETKKNKHKRCDKRIRSAETDQSPPGRSHTEADEQSEYGLGKNLAENL